MGEAKRRKELGLAPKAPQKLKKDSLNLLAKYPMLPYILVGFFVVFLIVDLIKYYLF